MLRSLLLARLRVTPSVELRPPIAHAEVEEPCRRGDKDGNAEHDQDVGDHGFHCNRWPLSRGRWAVHPSLGNQMNLQGLAARFDRLEQRVERLTGNLIDFTTLARTS